MRTNTLIVCAVSLSILASTARAQTREKRQAIDDFSQGRYESPGFQSGTTSTITTSQSGDARLILGGTRTETLFLCTSPESCDTFNPFGQYSSYAIGPYLGGSQLVQTTGYMEGLRLELGYGGGARMSAELGAFSRIRVNFSGLTETLNFNVLAYTGTRYGQNACNIPPHAGAFSVEFPFSGFTHPGGAIDFNNIGYLDFIFQSGSAVGGVSFGVTSIEVSDTAYGNAVQCNFAQSISGG
jgi:hypothetical protein